MEVIRVKTKYIKPDYNLKTKEEKEKFENDNIKIYLDKYNILINKNGHFYTTKVNTGKPLLILEILRD